MSQTRIIGDRVELHVRLYTMQMRRVFDRVDPEVLALLPHQEYQIDRRLRLKTYGSPDTLTQVRSLTVRESNWRNVPLEEMYALALECPKDIPRRMFALELSYNENLSGPYFPCCEVTTNGLVAKIVSGMERLRPDDIILLRRN